ncbi:MAG: hypothetical protein ACREPA_09075 [Candidatus Dormibacteraceae bacterium]
MAVRRNRYEVARGGDAEPPLGPVEEPLHDVHSFQARKALGGPVDLAHGLAAIRSVEEVDGHAIDLLGPLHALADRLEAALHDEAIGLAGGPALSQQALGLRPVEGEVDPLLLDDPLDDLGQGRVIGPLDELLVAGQGRHLVDRAHGEVDGGEEREHVGAQEDCHHGAHPVEALAEADLPRAVVVDLDPVLAQEPEERLPVVHLLIDPDREEGGDDRVHAGLGDQQLGQVDDGVGLDVHHVEHRVDGPLGELVLANLGPVDVAQVELLRVLLVAVDVESHQMLLTFISIEPDSNIRGLRGQPTTEASTTSRLA